MNYQYWQEISFYLNELDKERMAFEKLAITPESIEPTRKKMVTLLDHLRTSLEQRLDKHHTSLILFAIVASIDEKMQSYDYNETKVRWAPIQKDFYSAFTAGEVFYKSLDEILDDPSVPNIVYQVFYSMLKRGFQGKYRESKTQIAKYLDMLKDKIPTTIVTAKKNTVNPPQSNSKKERFNKWHYYGLSSALFLATFVSLFLISRFYSP